MTTDPVDPSVKQYLLNLKARAAEFGQQADRIRAAAPWDVLPKVCVAPDQCDCTNCVVHALTSYGLARRSAREMAHDLDPNCRCETCLAVQKIKEQYE